MTPSRPCVDWEPTAGPEGTARPHPDRAGAWPIGAGRDASLGASRGRSPCRSWARGLWSGVTGVLDLVSPGRCAVCHDLSDVLLCPDCLSGCARPAGPCCLHCGEPWRAADADGCGRCRRFGRPFAFDRAAAVWAYEGPVRRLVHGFKFLGQKEVLAPLGRLMAQHPVVGAWARHGRRAWVVSVPAGAASRRRRGYDQARLLGRSLAAALGRPFDPRALSRRRQPGLSQARSSADDRRRRMRASFAARPASVWGRHLLLVDDVLSTGATADAASRALRCAGARSVTVLALAT